MITQLSPHFSLQEACKSQIAIRLGIDNTPPDSIIPRLQATALNVLEPLRTVFGPFSPSSWYRCPSLNRAVKGKLNSQHIYGYAVDLEIAGHSNKEIANYIRDHLDFDQLLLEYYIEGQPHSGWVHVSWKNKDNRHYVGYVK